MVGEWFYMRFMMGTDNHVVVRTPVLFWAPVAFRLFSLVLGFREERDSRADDSAWGSQHRQHAFGKAAKVGCEGWLQEPGWWHT